MSDSKLIVANVAKYFLQESKKETSQASYIRRPVEATGASRFTVLKIRKEQMNTGILRSPKRPLAPTGGEMPASTLTRS